MGQEVNSAELPPQAATAETVDALLEAARYNDIDDLTSLISAGIPLDSKDSEGRTALHMASANGHLDIVGYLIRSEAVVMKDANPVDFNSEEVGVETPISEQCCTLMFFIEDVNARNLENNTPLHWASLNGHIEVVKHLILAGANIALLNSHERSPIDEAVSRGKMDVIDAINEAAAQVELSTTRVS